MNDQINLSKALFITICLLGFLFPLEAQVHINEYSASNLESFYDDFGKTEDWIELYNAGDVEVDISGWHLSDKESKPMKWAIPQNTSIPSKGFLIFYCSGRDGKPNNAYHTNFKLAQSNGKDIVLLSDPSGNVIEQFDMEITLVEHSRCRATDGSPEWVVSTNPTHGESNDGIAQYDAYTVAPSMDLAAGYYNGIQSVNVINNQPNSELRYTIDGTNPTEDSPIYDGAITVSQTMVVKAVSFSLDPRILPGKMDFNTYLIDEDFSLAVFSIGANDVKELANGDGPLIPIGSLEYFNKDKEREATSFGSMNRHGQDSWILDHRSLDWVSRDEMGYSKAVNAPLFSYSERDEYQKFMFRNSGDDNYPATGGFANQGSTHVRDEYVQSLAQLGDMSLDFRAVERVVVFLNGEYWGVYGMRDRPVDHDYTDYYYDQGKYDLQYLTTWGSTEIQYGGARAQQDWEGIRDFVLDNDMSVPENYAIAEDSINMVSLIDYMLMNLNVVASDWLNYNTGWWRGLNPEGDHKKWGYILWDLDATFDFYINYSGVPNTDPDAQPCDLEDIAEYMEGFFGGNFPDVGQHEKLFLKFLDESPEFQQLYYGRYADLMNTVFTCENMTTVLDSMVATIRPEMPRQIDRWGGSIQEWESNVTSLRDFILERCTLLDEGALGCYDELSGPYEITLMVEPNIGIGEIDFNSLDIEEFPWSGSYFGGSENTIKAKVFDEFEADYQFSHWVGSTGNTITPNTFERKANILLTENGTLTAVFVSMDADIDQDGYIVAEDCNDNDPLINPGAVELCDGIDNNCDGEIDEGFSLTTFYVDNDGDGYGDPNTFIEVCALPAGYTLDNTDCDDANPEVNIGAVEIPNNGLDDDCDGVEEIVFLDEDGDGFASDVDCDDTDPTINPDAIEICDNIDNNCDGEADEGLTYDIYYVDGDLDGYGSGDGFIDCIQPFEATTISGDCDDQNPDINPGAIEINGNGVDENCDGVDGGTAIYQLSSSLVKVYPNPTTDKLFIETDLLGLVYEVFTVQGKKVLDGNLSDQIDLVSLKPGVYLLKLKLEQTEMIIMKKVIKM